MATRKCPVCDWAIGDDAKSVRVDGQTVTVCCDDCAAKVKADPRKYVPVDGASEGAKCT